MEKAQLVVGFIRGSHGFMGECKVESASGEYEHLLKLKEVTLRLGDISREVKVESISLGHNIAYVKFEGINSDSDVMKYNRFELLVPRKYCKPLKKDEWYIEDLRDCSLVYEGKDDPATLDAPKVLGKITDVLEGGGGYLLEVSLSESCDRRVLVPFRNEFIGKVDVKNGTVQLMHLWILE
ncbi:MAG: ribosome maturation factor RimM [Spirochaetia bacterium]|nr:ribosome maturation factor RimM [Spirochaetia bacterium]MDD7269237.1 ribosome maturation factor RimM [Treponema sp.]MDY4985800.1 ribosome maturation factor RimM [Treponema sp.]